MISGLHHVTAIAGDAQRNVDFYAGVLGLRLVKKTINYDDPTTYHLYYGNAWGQPGTLLTFFAWPGAHRGKPGLGETSATTLLVPEGALPFWQARLKAAGVPAQGPGERFGEPILLFTDPDGMVLELVARGEAGKSQEFWAEGGVPQEAAIRGVDGVAISIEGYERTSRLLADVMGWRLEKQEGNRYRYMATVLDRTAFGKRVDVLCRPDLSKGVMGAGIVHHIAFRTPSEASQKTWRGMLTGSGHNVSPVMDRQYFQSIYFREPGGVLFEIATDPPGFTADEPKESLGTRLCLPQWMEGQRPLLEQVLKPLSVPKAG